MINETDYQKGKKLIQEFTDFVTNDLNGKIYKEDYLEVNYYKLPNTIINMVHNNLNQQNIARLNAFIAEIKSSSYFTKLKRTKSGGISIVGSYLHSHPFQYDINGSSSKYIVTIVTSIRCFKIILGYAKENKDKKDGATPSKRLIKKCNDYEIDLEQYANSKEEGMLAAKMIHKPEVRVVDAKIADNSDSENIYYGNIHHLDFHKFYPSGIAMLHPEFRAPFAALIADDDKEALDIGTRYLASKYANYQYAKLIKEGINFMYERFFQVADDMKKSGRTILAFNTDGIWYQGDIYHGIYEGKGMGCWENDYINVQKIRFKSEGLGAYEFIREDGIYEPRYKGLSSYEREVPREEWIWGDIYKGSEIKISFDSVHEQFIIKGV